jgi:hypothetical protein
MPKGYRQRLDTAAFAEPCEIGEVVDIMGVPYRILAAMTREEYMQERDAHRADEEARGLPKATRGTYDGNTREFRPLEEMPEEYKFCYRLEPTESEDNLKKLQAARERVIKESGPQIEKFGYNFSMLMASAPPRLVFSACLSALIVAGRDLGYDKMRVQKELVGCWDELEKDEARRANS